MRLIEAKKVLTQTQQEYFDSLEAIINGGFSFTDQIAKPLTFTWNSDTTPSVLTQGRTRPLTVLILAAVDPTDTATTMSGLPCSWTWDAGKVRIVSVVGLTDSTDYQLTILPVMS